MRCVCIASNAQDPSCRQAGKQAHRSHTAAHRPRCDPKAQTPKVKGQRQCYVTPEKTSWNAPCLSIWSSWWGLFQSKRSSHAQSKSCCFSAGGSFLSSFIVEPRRVFFVILTTLIGFGPAREHGRQLRREWQGRIAKDREGASLSEGKARRARSSLAKPGFRNRV